MYTQHVKYEFSTETIQVMRSPVAKIAILIVGAATLVLVFQILHRISIGG
jgi:hypothetical protein